MMDFIIFILSIILYIPASIVNFLIVRKSGYLKDTGITLSKALNRDHRTLLNKCLKKKGCGHEFGTCDETVSSALGKNQCLGTLSKTGRILVKILHKCESHHCLRSVHDDAFEEKKQELMNKKS
jgi:hypothetical protein